MVMIHTVGSMAEKKSGCVHTENPYTKTTRGKQHKESGNNGFREYTTGDLILSSIHVTYKLLSELLRHKLLHVPRQALSLAPLRQTSRGFGKSRRTGDPSLDGVDDTGISQGAEITQLVALPGRDLTHDTAHDLARPGLGEVGNDVDLLRGGERTDDLPDLEDELLREGSLIVGVISEFTRWRIPANSQLRKAEKGMRTV